MSDTSIDTAGKKTVKTNITYNIENGGKAIKTSLPFTIGILLDTTAPQEKSLADQSWVELKPGNNVDFLLQNLNISEVSRRDLSNFLGKIINVPMLQVWVISRSKANFADDLTGNKDKCELYKALNKIETVYGTGFSVLLSDYHFNENSDDTILLQKISVIAEELQVPFIAATYNSQTEIDLPFVRLQASTTIDTYHNPVFQLAEHITFNFDRYAWPVVSEQPEAFSYQLIACHFAQYIKIIFRSKIGSFMTRANVESFLNNWISQYILLDDQISPEIQARYPLKAARIDIMQVPNEFEYYDVILFINPQFILGAQPTSIRLDFKLFN